MTRALKTMPWQLWVVDFGVPLGHEQAGVRPVIVVGSPGHCALAIDVMLSKVPRGFPNISSETARVTSAYLSPASFARLWMLSEKVALGLSSNTSSRIGIDPFTS